MYHHDKYVPCLRIKRNRCIYGGFVNVVVLVVMGLIIIIRISLFKAILSQEYLCLMTCWYGVSFFIHVNLNVNVKNYSILIIIIFSYTYFIYSSYSYSYYYILYHNYGYFLYFKISTHTILLLYSLKL